MAERLDLGAVLKDHPLVGADKLAFVGGAVKGTDAAVGVLLTWLGERGAGPWWSFREWTDRVRLCAGLVLGDAGAGAEGEPAAPPLPSTDGDDGDGGGGARLVGGLVWGRWFGAPGDLEVWRDGERFRWRFVGEVAAKYPASKDQDFFAAAGAGGEPPRLCDGGECAAQLWKPTDARAATADECTLALLRAADRQLILHYTPYYDHGMLAAVRYRAIVPGAADARRETTKS